MNLTTITQAQRTAAEVEQITGETIAFVEFQLKRLHAMASDQSVLDVFGTNAASALGAYSAFHAALSAVKPDHSAPAPDTTIFQPQSDGRVIYVAPEEPEIGQPAAD